ncbi:MAG: hypothetical protein LIO55_01370, partial [Oscillospiraceae bacterium]|nr:hypothetical protein [Oscillospiraceae bacterium]
VFYYKEIAVPVRQPSATALQLLRNVPQPAEKTHTKLSRFRRAAAGRRGKERISTKNQSFSVYYTKCCG